MLFTASTALIAQTVPSTETRVQAPYTPRVWDIDWDYLAAPGNRQDWTDRLHYVPIGKNLGTFLSINGQIRERGEYQDHPDFGAQPDGNGYFLQRHLAWLEDDTRTARFKANNYEILSNGVFSNHSASHCKVSE